MKKKISMFVLNSFPMAEDIWSLELQYPGEEVPEEVRPGQFVGLYPKGGDMLLMRPISICAWDPVRRALRFVYRAGGKGTRSFTELQPGDAIDMLGILGNGYDVASMAGKRVLLLGGGIGIPPMLQLARALSARKAGAGTDGPASVTAVLGYRDDALFLKSEIARHVDACHFSTEDGSRGMRGNVLDVIRQKGLEADVICACGPMPMLRAVSRYAAQKGIPAYVSLEERMACGIGVCLGCVVKTSGVDRHSGVRNARTCVEGPVFLAEDVDWEA